MHLLSNLMKGKHIALKKNTRRQEGVAEIGKEVIHLLLRRLLEEEEEKGT